MFAPVYPAATNQCVAFRDMSTESKWDIWKMAWRVWCKAISPYNEALGELYKEFDEELDGVPQVPFESMKTYSSMEAHLQSVLPDYLPIVNENVDEAVDRQSVIHTVASAIVSHPFNYVGFAHIFSAFLDLKSCGIHCTFLPSADCMQQCDMAGCRGVAFFDHSDLTDPDIEGHVCIHVASVTPEFYDEEILVDAYRAFKARSGCMTKIYNGSIYVPTFL